MAGTLRTCASAKQVPFPRTIHICARHRVPFAGLTACGYRLIKVAATTPGQTRSIFCPSVFHSTIWKRDFLSLLAIVIMFRFASDGVRKDCRDRCSLTDEPCSFPILHVQRYLDVVNKQIKSEDRFISCSFLTESFFTQKIS